MRLNTSVDSFFRHENVRSHFTDKRADTTLTGNIPVKKSDIKVPAGIPQEDVPSYIRERVQSHVVNTVPLTVN
ncbi:hypothetical protein, partial [Catenuloplanes japonicus]|uniref:hypothetical protein n=1 Tax=Catenuloplanes japonicus TaxID=33876 RepID=UPI0005240ADA